VKVLRGAFFTKKHGIVKIVVFAIVLMKDEYVEQTSYDKNNDGVDA